MIQREMHYMALMSLSTQIIVAYAWAGGYMTPVNNYAKPEFEKYHFRRPDPWLWKIFKKYETCRLYSKS